MRLCQPFFRALARSFTAVWLLSGVMAALALAGAAAMAGLIDAQIAHQTLSTQTPLLAVILIAGLGGAVLSLARATLLNRRRVWIEHRMAEYVLAHELWLASDARQRDRSLAAVATIGRFIGAPCAVAIAEAPWSLAILAGCGWFDRSISMAAGVAVAVLMLLTLWGSRVTRAARGFDAAGLAVHAGLDVIAAADLNTGASLDRAHAVAERWETSQRAYATACYTHGQSRARRHIVAGTVIGFAGFAVVAMTLAPDATRTLSVGGLAAVAAITCASLWPFLRLAIDAAHVAQARAARQQLLSLRVARTREGDARSMAIAAPDLRAPLTAGMLATAAAAASLLGAATYWQLPVLASWTSAAVATDARNIVGAHTPRAATAAATVPYDHIALDAEIKGLRAGLTRAGTQLTELRREADGLSRAGPTDTDAAARLRTIEAAGNALTASVGTMLKRIAILERELAEAAAPQPQLAPHNATTELPVREGQS